MKLFTFTAVDTDGEVDIFVIQAARKPTKKQAVRLAYELAEDDEAINMVLDSYTLEIKPVNIITFNGKFQW